MRISRSFITIFLAITCFGSAFQLKAQQTEFRISNATLRKQVISVIEGQLEAFRLHDLNKAFSYASVSLQRHLPQAIFMSVAMQNYPEIWANASADFGLVKDNQLHSTIQVRVIAQDGSYASYDYDLAYESGTWKIDGILRHQQKKTPAA
jgi:hypothetical protein